MSNPISQSFTIKSLLTFTLPSTIMMVFLATYTMSGSMLAAKYVGQDAFAAMNIAFPFISTIAAIAVMFATGSNAIVASNLGEKNYKRARENFTTIVAVGTLIGTSLSVFTFLFKVKIISFLGAPLELQKLGENYLSVYSIAFPFMFLQIFCQYFFVTIGKQLYSMSALIVGGILSFISSYISMAILNIGVIGAAIGSVISFILPGILFIMYFLFKKNNLLYFIKPKLHKNFLLNTCINGSSEMVTNFAIAIVTMVLNLLMSRAVGANGIAAVAVIVQVQFLLNSVYIGFGGGIAPIFAYAKGSNNYHQIKNVFNLSKKLIIISSVLLVIVSLTFASKIVLLFIAEGSPAFELALEGFKIFALGYFFAGTSIFASVFFTSLSNGKVSVLISFLRTFVFILGMLLILPPILNTTGIWLAIPAAEFLSLIVVLFIFKKNKIIL